jgi:DNA-binding CsgD family transcriptional regulator
VGAGVGVLIGARDRLRAAGERPLATNELCTEIAAAIREVAPYEQCALLTTDLDTMLPAGGVVEGFSADDCVPFWDTELLDPDFCKFTELARSTDPVASLYQATEGALDRSPRWQKLYRHGDAADELRVAIVAGTSCLAVGAFVRGPQLGPFTDAEMQDVRQLLPVAAIALRRALGRGCHDTLGHPPVVILLDADGRVTGMTEGGERVLADLRMNEPNGDLPGIVSAAAIKARWSRTATNLTTRVRGRSGHWLRLHVAPIRDDAGAVALTVEMARSGDLVQILLESYELTPRESEITLLLCRGLSTKEIAAELLISAHTVRDHVKAIYEKAGVSSRGELVAGLFSTHVLEPMHASITHV